MMAEGISSGFWKGFARGVSEWGDKLGMEGMQVRMEERADVRLQEKEKRDAKLDYQALKKRNELAIEMFEETAGIQEEFSIRTETRANAAKVDIIKLGTKLQKDWFEYEQGYKRKLEDAYGIESYRIYKQKALTTTGDKGNEMQRNILKWEQEANMVISGQKELDLGAFKDAPPLWVNKISQIAFDRFNKKRTYDQQMQTNQRLLLAAETAADTAKSLASLRKTTEGSKIDKSFKEYDAIAKKSSKAYNEFRSELMNILRDKNVLDPKGGLT